ncbi:MAG: hypothetical protein ACRCRU_11735 [Vibrio sp.]|uniref:hypothetical protein n=1 Tax=Vibrio sp. TaxID=678 RepID=UPI003F3ABBD7
MMKVTYYTTQDGEPWGLFIDGYVDKETALAAFNVEAEYRGFEPVALEQIEHTFGAFDKTESEFNFYIATDNVAAAVPITYVDGESLVFRGI